LLACRREFTSSWFGCCRATTITPSWLFWANQSKVTKNAYFKKCFVSNFEFKDHYYLSTCVLAVHVYLFALY
jgi:hypothetical protein